MKALVTGATGFVGQHIVAALLSRGHHVTVASRSRERLQACPWQDAVSWVPREIGAGRRFALPGDDLPEVLIHAAWSNLHDYRSLVPLEELLLPHYFFIKQLVTAGVSRCVVTGTCLEYGLQEGALAETDAAAPVVPYAIAKNVLRQMLLGLQTSHPFRLQWLRLFYLHGEGQRPSSLLAQLEQALERSDEVFDMSPGDQQRDYLPVTEAARLICRLAENTDYDGIVNCCSGKPVAVADLVRRHAAARGKSLQLNLGRYDYPDYEPRHFWGDVTLLHQLTGPQQ